MALLPIARWLPPVRRYALLLALAALPAMLSFSAWLSFKEFAEMRRVYLRHQAASLAARLETSSPSTYAQLIDEEPALMDLQVFPSTDPAGADPDLAPLWSGQELFRIEETPSLFRAYIPFHSANQLHIARIDLDPQSADFLVRHASHNVIIAFTSAAALIALSLYALFSSRRAATLEKHEIELRHLAHLGELAAVLAHEIRNPLGSIKGFAQLALEKAPPHLQPYLQPIPAEALRLEKLVSDLLLYARMPSPSPQLIRWREFAATLPGPVSISPTDADLSSDPDLLRHILTNLIHNATHATASQSDPAITLDLQHSTHSWIIRVADNGPLVTAEQLTQMLKPFYTTKPTGTGLGLPIARKLATALGGELTLRANSPHGLIVQLTLPEVAPCLTS